jgi:hypothetical protein
MDLRSTGQRNSLIEYVCWTSKVKRLARTLIESKSNPIQVRLREAGQIRAFGEVLPQQAVRVFVCSSLPRAPKGEGIRSPRALVAVSPYGTSWHLMALPDRTKFSE